MKATNKFPFNDPVRLTRSKSSSKVNQLTFNCDRLLKQSTGGFAQVVLNGDPSAKAQGKQRLPITFQSLATDCQSYVARAQMKQVLGRQLGTAEPGKRPNSSCVKQQEAGRASHHNGRLISRTSNFRKGTEETKAEEYRRITKMLSHPSTQYPMFAVKGTTEEIIIQDTPYLAASSIKESQGSIKVVGPAAMGGNIPLAVDRTREISDNSKLLPLTSTAEDAQPTSTHQLRHYHSEVAKKSVGTGTGKSMTHREDTGLSLSKPIEPSKPPKPVSNNTSKLRVLQAPAHTAIAENDYGYPASSGSGDRPPDQEDVISSQKNAMHDGEMPRDPVYSASTSEAKLMSKNASIEHLTSMKKKKPLREVSKKNLDLINELCQDEIVPPRTVESGKRRPKPFCETNDVLRAAAQQQRKEWARGLKTCDQAQRLPADMTAEGSGERAQPGEAQPDRERAPSALNSDSNKRIVLMKSQFSQSFKSRSREHTDCQPIPRAVVLPACFSDPNNDNIIVDISIPADRYASHDDATRVEHGPPPASEEVEKPVTSIGAKPKAVHSGDADKSIELITRLPQEVSIIYNSNYEHKFRKFAPPQVAGRTGSTGGGLARLSSGKHLLSSQEIQDRQLIKQKAGGRPESGVTKPEESTVGKATAHETRQGFLSGYPHHRTAANFYMTAGFGRPGFRQRPKTGQPHGGSRQPVVATQQAFLDSEPGHNFEFDSLNPASNSAGEFQADLKTGSQSNFKTKQKQLVHKITRELGDGST